MVLVGVGGQGTITAANLLANALLAHGFDVKTSEVHGMAQRGGSVVSMVRYGAGVASPPVPRGTAEALIATELLEALRSLEFLSDDGVAICSRTRIDPLPVLQGAEEYPADAEEKVERLTGRSIIVDAADIAASLGDARAANTVLLGILSVSLPPTEEEWLQVIERLVPKKALEVSRACFLEGREIGSSAGERIA